MAQEPQRDPMIGRLFAGRFQIEQRVGSGGMGNIYRAQQVEMKRPVALKVLHPDLSHDAEVLARFDRELRTTTRIEHPNSVRVYEHGRAPEGELYLVMELLDGVPLAEAIAEGAPFPAERVAHIGMQMAGALAAAHAEKIVHRDLKPENVMLLDRYGQKDFVKVLDFGLSRFSEDEAENDDNPGLTQTGVRVGTPLYMAPEYVSAFQFDHRSDLYALGCILFEMGTGKPPYIGRPYEILERHIAAEVPKPAQRCPGFPAWFGELIEKLLAKDPGQRPQSAMEVFHALERGRARLISEPTEDANALQEAVEALQRAKEPPAEPTPAPASMPVSSPASTLDNTGRHSLAKARASRANPPIVAPSADEAVGDDPTVELLDLAIPARGPVTAATPAPAPRASAARTSARAAPAAAPARARPPAKRPPTATPVSRRPTTEEVVEGRGGTIAAFGCVGAAVFGGVAVVLVVLLAVVLMGG